MNKRRVIIEGRPAAAVTVGCPAYIQQSNGILLHFSDRGNRQLVPL